MGEDLTIAVIEVSPPATVRGLEPKFVPDAKRPVEIGVEDGEREAANHREGSVPGSAGTVDFDVVDDGVV